MPSHRPLCAYALSHTVLFRKEHEIRKSDIAAHIADRVSLSKGLAEDAVNALLEAIRGALANGEEVPLPGFGTFSTRSRPVRRGQSPFTCESRLTWKALSFHQLRAHESDGSCFRQP